MSLPQQFERNQAGAKPESLGCVGVAIMLLFGLGFSAGGLFVFSQALFGLRDYIAMKSWKTVPARILGASLESHQGNKGGTTYGISVRYEYAYDGVTRQGARADLFPRLHEGLGKYQRRVVAALQAAQSSGRTVPCYVNPADPSESILDREMRWGALAGTVLFSIAFLSVGLGAFGMLLFFLRQERTANARQVLYPEEPWRARLDWAEGRIRSFSRSGAILTTMLALIWNSVSLMPFTLSGGEIFDKGHPERLLVLLFPAVGIFMIVVAVRSWRAWGVLGDPVFHMSKVPGVIGGVLAGTIESKCTRWPSAEVQLTLTCTERRRQGRESIDRIIWQNRRALRPESVQMGPQGLSLPVLFEIPYDYGQSRPGDEANYSWRLELKGDFEGTAASARFEVPVFRTAASDPNFKPAKKAEASYFKAPEPDEILKASAVSLEPIPGGGRRYVFHANRSWGLALPMTLVALIMTAISAGVWYWSAPLPFRIISSLFEILFLLIAADIWLWSGCAELTPQGVAFAGGIFRKAKVVYVAIEDIQRFVLDGSVSYGDKVYYNLQVETKAGKKITLGKRLKERSHGEWLIAEMENDLLGETTKVGAELNA